MDQSVPRVGAERGPGEKGRVRVTPYPCRRESVDAALKQELRLCSSWGWQSYTRQLLRHSGGGGVRWLSG